MYFSICVIELLDDVTIMSYLTFFTSFHTCYTCRTMTIHAREPAALVAPSMYKVLPSSLSLRTFLFGFLLTGSLPPPISPYCMKVFGEPKWREQSQRLNGGVLDTKRWKPVEFGHCIPKSHSERWLNSERTPLLVINEGKHPSLSTVFL